MGNPSGAKGYRGEAPVLLHLVRRGFSRAYRLRSQGVNDKGDIGGIDGVCIEIKNHGVYKFPEWMRELKREKANAGASNAVLVVKPRGIGEKNVGEWWAVLTLDDYLDLLSNVVPKEGGDDR